MAEQLNEIAITFTKILKKITQSNSSLIRMGIRNFWKFVNW
jgi:hypothetical protein